MAKAELRIAARRVSHVVYAPRGNAREPTHVFAPKSFGRQRARRLSCSALRERSLVAVSRFEHDERRVEGRDLLIFENCTEKNFHVPNMKAGPFAYFRARADANS